MPSHGHGPHEVSAEARKAGHEVGDVRLGTMIRYGIGLTALAVVSCFLAWLLFRALSDDASRTSARPTAIQLLNQDQPPPAPRLQVDPLKNWLTFKAEQDSLLSSYGWVDKAQGKVRLPIDRALEIMVGRDWPHRPGEYRQTGVSTQHPLPGKSHGPNGEREAALTGTSEHHPAAPSEGSGHAAPTGSVPVEPAPAGAGGHR